jgi:hypothetical protein
VIGKLLALKLSCKYTKVDAEACTATEARVVLETMWIDRYVMLEAICEKGSNEDIVRDLSGGDTQVLHVFMCPNAGILNGKVRGFALGWISKRATRYRTWWNKQVRSLGGSKWRGGPCTIGANREAGVVKGGGYIGLSAPVIDNLAELLAGNLWTEGVKWGKIGYVERIGESSSNSKRCNPKLGY